MLIKKNFKTRLIFITLSSSLSTIKLVLGLLYQTKLNKYRISSPPTSCQRLGLCSSTPSRSWWSWLLPALKNRPSVTSTWTRSKIDLFINHQLIKIKFTLDKIWTGNNLLLTKEGDNDVIVDDDELNDGDRETVRTGRPGKPTWRHLLTDKTFSDRVTVHKKTWNPILFKTIISK